MYTVHTLDEAVDAQLEALDQAAWLQDAEAAADAREELRRLFTIIEDEREAARARGFEERDRETYALYTSEFGHGL